jgi:hypothetical protein
MKRTYDDPSHNLIFSSLDIVFGIVTTPKARQPTNRGWSPGMRKRILFYSVQTGYEVHTTLYSMGTGESYPGCIAAGV